LNESTNILLTKIKSVLSKFSVLHLQCFLRMKISKKDIANAGEFEVAIPFNVLDINPRLRDDEFNR
jgi:hypothetical protein